MIFYGVVFFMVVFRTKYVKYTILQLFKIIPTYTTTTVVRLRALLVEGKIRETGDPPAESLRIIIEFTCFRRQII